MNLTEWVHAQGIHVQTACRWHREGTLPVPVRKVGRLILVSPERAAEAARKTEGAGLYARVSWHDQKSGLDGRWHGCPPGRRKPGCRWCGRRPRSGPG